MKNLCVFTLYSEKGASSQYRTYIFKNELEKNFHVKWFHFWNDNYTTYYMHDKRRYAFRIVFQYVIAVVKRWIQLTFVASKCDVVLLQKASIPKMRNTFLERLKKKNIKVIFDVDDAIYEIKGDNSKEIAELSDCVICGNYTLKNYYDQFNENCIVLPTIENTFKYIPFWKNTYDEKIIGWIGSRTTIDNLDLVIDALNCFTKRHPEVKIAIISNTAEEYISKIRNSYLIKWNMNTYLKELSKFSIGIMPLKDNKINRGKCGFKLVQYMNMKKPVIGSGVGVNEELIKGNGYEANSTDEWIEAMERLLYSKETYDACVRHIEEKFLNMYHFAKVSKKLLKILNE